RATASERQTFHPLKSSVSAFSLISPTSTPGKLRLLDNGHHAVDVRFSLLRIAILEALEEELVPRREAQDSVAEEEVHLRLGQVLELDREGAGISILGLDSPARASGKAR